MRRTHACMQTRELRHVQIRLRARRVNRSSRGCPRHCIRVSYSTDGAKIYRACVSSRAMTVLHCVHTLLHDICDNQHFRDLSPYVVRCHCLQAGERMDRRDCRRDCHCDSSNSSIAFRNPAVLTCCINFIEVDN